MIKIGMDTIIFHLGFFSFAWHSLAVLVAAIAGLLWTINGFRKEGLKTDPVYTISVWALIGGIVGSRLIHVINHTGFYLANPGDIFGREGESITGALLGGALASYIGARVHKIDFWHLADMAAPGLLLAQAIGRIGCTINGDAPGTPTSLPWGVIYTNPGAYAPLNISTHPAVLYEMAWDMIAFVILLKLKGKLAPAGSIFITYVVLYSTGRFFIDFFRANNVWAFGLHQAQVLTLLTLMIFIPVLIFRTHRASKQQHASSGS